MTRLPSWCLAVLTLALGWSASASAQTACMVATDCPDGTCVVPHGGAEGVCVSRLSAAGCPFLGPGTVRVASRCFGEGSTNLERFANGDCDADFVSNRDESTATICAGGAVMTWGSSYGVTTGQTLRSTTGSWIAPREAGARSNLPNAVGIACDATTPCPSLPYDDGSGTRSAMGRCVWLDAVGGICTYHQGRTGDDTSCVGTSPTRGVCLASTAPAGDPYAAWADGDCDGDGFTNAVDPLVCDTALRVVGVLAGMLVCRDGALDNGRCSFPVRELAPGFTGCSLEAIQPFGFCCTRGTDCPNTRAAGWPRCVTLTLSDGVPGGVCVYSEHVAVDDVTCSVAGTGNACLVGAEDYGDVAGGDCDECGPDNDDDHSVCFCDERPDAGMEPDATVTEPDAGAHLDDAAVDFDAAIPMGVDAALDARTTDPDANRDDAASGDMPPTFGGSGCQCAVGPHAETTGWPHWLALVPWALLALRRRRR